MRSRLSRRCSLAHICGCRRSFWCRPPGARECRSKPQISGQGVPGAQPRHVRPGIPVAGFLERGVRTRAAPKVGSPASRETVGSLISIPGSSSAFRVRLTCPSVRLPERPAGLFALGSRVPLTAPQGAPPAFLGSQSGAQLCLRPLLRSPTRSLSSFPSPGRPHPRPRPAPNPPTSPPASWLWAPPPSCLAPQLPWVPHLPSPAAPASWTRDRLFSCFTTACPV